MTLAIDLLKDKLTLVGTQCRNKKEMPLLLQLDKQQQENSSEFRFTDTATMVSYVPKRGKVVILLSTMHGDDKLGDGGKPDIILFYNSTKGGVDALDIQHQV